MHMEIIMTDYPFGLPQDIKWSVGKEGYQLIEAKQLEENKVKMVFTKGEIKTCSQCVFISHPPQKGMSIWCEHPEVKGSIKIENESYEIHPDCPIKLEKQTIVKHVDGAYLRNVERYKNVSE